MRITQDTAVTLKYQVTTPAGKPLDSGHLSYLHGGYENIFPKVEAALNEQAVGFALTLDLSAEDAFGERDESLVRVIPKSEFPPGVKVGGQLQGAGDDGQPRVFNVVKIKGPEVHLRAFDLHHVEHTWLAVIARALQLAAHFHAGWKF